MRANALGLGGAPLRGEGVGAAGGVGAGGRALPQLTRMSFER